MFDFIVLSQQHLEFLAMLDVKQQKVVQENMSFNKTGFTDITGLEVSRSFPLSLPFFFNKGGLKVCFEFAEFAYYVTKF